MEEVLGNEEFRLLTFLILPRTHAESGADIGPGGCGQSKKRSEDAVAEHTGPWTVAAGWFWRERCYRNSDRGGRGGAAGPVG